jgi:CRP-like cAMP-binding protein
MDGTNLHDLLEHEQDPGKLGQWTRELGYGLARTTVEELRQTRAELASLRDDPALDGPQHDFLRGVLFAMAEVCASYSAEIQAAEERRQLAAFGREKPLHGALLQKIFAGVTRPTDLAASLGKDSAQVSRALAELRALGLVELVSPGPAGDQRQRFHRLTTEGLRILSAQGWPASPGQPKPAHVPKERSRRAAALP